MEVYSIHLERGALKMFREEEQQRLEAESKRYWNSWSPFKVYETDDEESYEGGNRSQRSPDGNNYEYH